MDNPESAPTYTAILPPQPAPERDPRDPRNVRSALRIVILTVVVGAIVTALAASLVSSAAAARAIAYPMPKVEIASSTYNQGTAVAGQSLTFSAVPSAGRDLTYTWDFGDGSNATGINVSHTYSDYQQGGYQVSVTAVDPLHQTATASINLNVVPQAPTAQFTYAVDNSNPLTIDFDASASTGDGLNYVWAFGDNTSGQGAQVSNTYQSVGTYTVTLTVTDVANQSAEVSQSVSVTITKPVAAFTATQTSNDGFGYACYSFDASASSGYSLTYNWSFGDGNVENGDSGPQTQYCYNASGSYTVTLQVVDGVNQSSQISHTISY